MPKGNPLIRPQTKFEWMQFKQMYWKLRELYALNLSEYYRIKKGMLEDNFSVAMFNTIEKQMKIPRSRIKPCKGPVKDLDWVQ